VGITGELLWNKGRHEMFGVTASEENQTHLQKLAEEKLKKLQSVVADCLSLPGNLPGAAIVTLLLNGKIG
jgi:hypothetical protein